MVRRVLFIVCVLGCAATAWAQSSPVVEWPPRPPDMAQLPPPADMGAAPSDLARASADLTPMSDLKPPASSDGGPIKTINVPAGKTLDQVQLPRGTITNGAGGIGDVITDVKIVDNTRTDSETVRYIAGVKTGDILTNELVAEVRERLLTVGLFKDVNVSW